MRKSFVTRQNMRGFTLVEIMVVVIIIGILASFVVPNVMNKPGEARLTKAKQDISSLEAALNLYKLDNFDYPSTDAGLEALVTNPGDAPNWKGSYVKSLKKDPWQREYLYTYPGENGEVDIFSYGRDGRPGGDGEDADIGNWNIQ